MIKFSDIEEAFYFVNSPGYGINSAVINKDTGQVLQKSDMLAFDEIGEDYLDSDIWIYIPHKNDLNLGNRLVFEFVEHYLPQDYDEVRQIFLRKGAYGRFRGLLESRKMLDAWHQFQSRREEQALRKWCAEKKIDISD